MSEENIIDSFVVDVFVRGIVCAKLTAVSYEVSHRKWLES